MHLKDLEYTQQKTAKAMPQLIWLNIQSGLIIARLSLMLSSSLHMKARKSIMLTEQNLMQISTMQLKKVVDTIDADDTWAGIDNAKAKLSKEQTDFTDKYKDYVKKDDDGNDVKDSSGNLVYDTDKLEKRWQAYRI